MLGAYCIEAREGAFDVAENEVRCTCLDLDIDAPVREHQLNILIVFDDDVSQTSVGRLEETRDSIDVLIEEAAMNSFDSGDLAAVYVERLDGWRVCHLFAASAM